VCKHYLAVKAQKEIYKLKYTLVSELRETRVLLLSLCLFSSLSQKFLVSSWALVAHTCNPSYSGGRDQEDGGWNSAWANSSWYSILKKPITKKGWRSDSKRRHWVQTPVSHTKKNSWSPTMDILHVWSCLSKPASWHTWLFVYCKIQFLTFPTQL
jgi:hypothetical protein